MKKTYVQASSERSSRKTKGLIFFTFMILSSLIITSLVTMLSGCNGAPADPIGETRSVDYATRPEPIAPLTNGVNLMPDYYNGGNPDFAWSLMTQFPAIKTVRIEIESFIDISVAQGWIANAVMSGYTVIATYHDRSLIDGTPVDLRRQDDPNELMIAANWWLANYQNLTMSTSYITDKLYVNLCNEWGTHSMNASTYASAYNNAINVVRQVYTGPIIVDVPGWGQDVNTAANASSMISDGNIIFSAHIYPAAYNSGVGDFQPSHLDVLQATGRPCIIGEFGNYSAAGNKVDWAGVVNAAKAKGWPVLAWAWNGDGPGMNMVSPSWTTNPPAGTVFSTSPYFDIVYPLLQ